jgi:hypothetical protein
VKPIIEKENKDVKRPQKFGPQATSAVFRMGILLLCLISVPWVCTDLSEEAPVGTDAHPQMYRNQETASPVAARYWEILGSHLNFLLRGSVKGTRKKLRPKRGIFYT